MNNIIEAPMCKVLKKKALVYRISRFFVKQRAQSNGEGKRACGGRGGCGEYR